MLPNINCRLERGKKSAMAAIIANGRTGEYMIACVDADYDWIMQGCTQSSQSMLGSHFVFHTYAYSIENLQCYAQSLHNVCVMATLNDHILFDFTTFLHTYSTIIYPLFLWNVWHYRQAIYNKFSILDFCHFIEIGKVNPATAQDTLAALHNKVQKKLTAFRKQYPQAQETYRQLDIELQQHLHIQPQETYLYIQGHFLADHVVAPLLQRLCQTLVRERENDIRRSAAHTTQQRNELSCYASSIQDIQTMLKKNMGYITSKIYQRITEDIRQSPLFNEKVNNESG